MAEQSIEIEVSSQAKQATKDLDSLVNKFDDLSKSISNIEGVLTNMYLAFGSMEKNGIKVANTFKQVGKETDSMKNKLKSASGISFTGLINGVKRFSTKAYSFLESSVDASEQLNLFNVVFKNMQKNGETTFSELGKKATQFQNKLNQAYNTNKVETLGTQALYQSLGENIGIDSDIAETMSEAMTLMTYDLASLYNKSEKDVAEAIKSGVYTGQTRPMRQFGVDLTQANMGDTLASLGITDRTVSQLSQAEKEILRYITTLRQANVAMGDFSNTIDSPANQLKMLKQQLAELKIAIGNLFVNAFAKILPYVNAIIMVIKELVKSIANIFGIELTDFNAGGSISVGVDDLSESLDGVGSSADNASKKVKELKRQTLGFDQINNITSPSNSSSGSSGGSGGVGGIDSKLLDAVKAATEGYSSVLDGVKSKASDIRDKIMEWLGFTKEIDPVTGEVSWKYGGIDKTLGNMWTSFKNLSTPAKLLVGSLAYIGGVALLNGIKKLVSSFGSTGLGKAITNLFVPSENLKKKLGEIGGTNIKKGIESLKKSFELVKTAVSGLISVGLGLVLFSDSFKRIKEDGLNLISVIELVSATVLTIKGSLEIVSAASQLAGGKISASMAIATAGISLLVTAIVGVYTALKDNENELSDYELAVEEANEKWKELNDTAYSHSESTLAQFANYEKLNEELGKMLDNDGKISDDEKARASFIVDTLNKNLGTELTITDGILKNGEKTLETSKQLNDETVKLIGLKKGEAILTNYEESYVNALKEENKYKQRIETIQSKLGKKVKEYYTNVASGADVNSKSMKKLEEEIEDLQYRYSEVDHDMWQYTNTVQTYEELAAATAAGEYEKVDELINKMFKVTDTSIKGEIENASSYISSLPDEYKLNVNVDKKTAEEELKNFDKLASEKTKGRLIPVSVDLSKASKDLSNFTSRQQEIILKIETAISKNAVSEFKKVFGIKAEGGLYSNGSWKPITQYASGGLPSAGQMFIAREAGPELVGKIGNSTAVMNNNQIVSSVANGVAQAVASVMGSGSNAVELYVHSDEGVIIDKINRIRKQTGSCPIEI